MIGVPPNGSTFRPAASPTLVPEMAKRDVLGPGPREIPPPLLAYVLYLLASGVLAVVELVHGCPRRDTIPTGGWRA